MPLEMSFVKSDARRKELSAKFGANAWAPPSPATARRTLRTAQPFLTGCRVCGAEEHGDKVHAELCTLGVECHYQRQKLGAHGFGVAPRWTTPCAAWLLDKLRDSPQASAPAAQRHDTHV